MKLLIVAMRSIHTIRWISQLKDSGHEVHWFDILNTGYTQKLTWVHQHTNWRYRFGDFKGRTYLKKNAPLLHKFFERQPEKYFEQLCKEIQPDLVQSFALHIGAYPILEVMKNNPKITWLYSSWGSDLFYHKDIPIKLKEIEDVLPHVDFMFSDCHRDVKLAKKLGFTGRHLGIFPGGGGYPVGDMQQYIKPLDKRRIIVLKGYDGEVTNGLEALKALLELPKKLVEELTLVIYSTAKRLQQHLDGFVDYPFKEIVILPDNKNLKQKQLFEIFGKSLISINNNISDGIPNTLIESIILGAFPIQSNPGNASAELIEDRKNGLLIVNPLDVSEIKRKIEKALQSHELLQKAFNLNLALKSKFDENIIKPQVLQKYADIAIGNET
jgi:glycosyltransferase involved in cell wall biosynthesis